MAVKSDRHIFVNIILSRLEVCDKSNKLGGRRSSSDVAGRGKRLCLWKCGGWMDILEAVGVLVHFVLESSATGGKYGLTFPYELLQWGGVYSGGGGGKGGKLAQMTRK